MPDDPRRFFVREREVTPYSPVNHYGTVNRRLIGTVEPSRGALPHSHPGIEQVCYRLQGRAVAEVGEQKTDLGVGDCCFFPADEPHVFTAVGDETVRAIVIYSPPYVETGAVRH